MWNEQSIQIFFLIQVPNKFAKNQNLMLKFEDHVLAYGNILLIRTSSMGELGARGPGSPVDEPCREKIPILSHLLSNFWVQGKKVSFPREKVPLLAPPPTTL